MTQDTLNRRRFLLMTTTTVASILVGCQDKQTILRAQSESLDASAMMPSSGDLRCETTSKDITGPYWRPGIPVRQNFDLYGHEGARITLTGRVRDEKCRPVSNAVIEMWHARPTRTPANALTRLDSVDYDMTGPAFRYYGQFATDAQGRWQITTKKPGWYLNGSTFRPSHIHARIYVNGLEKLTTQLYFEGDPFIAGDPWASRAPERTVALKSGGKNQLSGRFDFTVNASG